MADLFDTSKCGGLPNIEAADFRFVDDCHIENPPFQPVTDCPDIGPLVAPPAPPNPAIGPPGAPGTIWYYGSSAPSNSLGITGNFYLQTGYPPRTYVKAGAAWVLISSSGIPSNQTIQIGILQLSSSNVTLNGDTVYNFEIGGDTTQLITAVMYATIRSYAVVGGLTVYGGVQAWPLPVPDLFTDYIGLTFDPYHNPLKEMNGNPDVPMDVNVLIFIGDLVVPTAVVVSEQAGNGVDERAVQSIYIKDSGGGTFSISYTDGVSTWTTSDLAYDDDATAVKNALEFLDTLGAPGIASVSVTGSGIVGYPWVITFLDDFNPRQLLVVNLDDLQGSQEWNFHYQPCCTDSNSSGGGSNGSIVVPANGSITFQGNNTHNHTGSQTFSFGGPAAATYNDSLTINYNANQTENYGTTTKTVNGNFTVEYSNSPTWNIAGLLTICGNVTFCNNKTYTIPGLVGNGANDTLTLRPSPTANASAPGRISMPNAAISMTGIATPGTNPPSGSSLLYPKSDDKWYTLDSSGTERLVGPGSTTPGGSDTQLQFNNSGSFEGAAELTYVDNGLRTATWIDYEHQSSPPANPGNSTGRLSYFGINDSTGYMVLRGGSTAGQQYLLSATNIVSGAGSLVYCDGTANHLAELVIGANKSIMGSDGSNPVWVSIGTLTDASSADVSGTAGATYGSTEQAMLNDVAALANELKTRLNALQQAMRDAPIAS